MGFILCFTESCYGRFSRMACVRGVTPHFYELLRIFYSDDSEGLPFAYHGPRRLGCQLNGGEGKGKGCGGKGGGAYFLSRSITAIKSVCLGRARF